MTDKRKASHTFPFLGWSILVRMSFAWDSRAARLEALGVTPPSLAFFPFFFPPSFTLGVFGSLGGLGGLGGFGGLGVFFLDVFSLGGVGTWAGDTGSSGSGGGGGGSSAGGLPLGSALMAFVAFCKRAAAPSR